MFLKKIECLLVGDRLTLIKSVLRSLHLYHFSVFHNPIKRVGCNFFWVRTKEESDILDTLGSHLQPMEKGGLRVGCLRAKNLALLGKWWWRFKDEDEVMWVKIIKSIHGSEGGMDRDVAAAK